MSHVVLIRPNSPGDPAAADLFDWAEPLLSELISEGNSVDEIDHSTPCDRASVDQALAAGADALIFFGHGNPLALEGLGGVSLVDPASDGSHVQALIAVACKAGLGLGPLSIQAGFQAFLGWNMTLIWTTPPGGRAPIGDAIAAGSSELAHGASMQDACAAIVRELEYVAQHFDSGPGSSDPEPDRTVGYLGAIAAAAQVTMEGDITLQPL